MPWWNFLRPAIWFWLATLLVPSLLRAERWVDHGAEGSLSFRSTTPLANGADLLRQLRDIQDDIHAKLDLNIPEAPIEISVFARKNEYQAHLKPRMTQPVHRRAIYIQGTDKGRIYVYLHNDWQLDVRHEATHAYLHNALPFLPTWLDEGLAEYFEVPASQRDARAATSKRVRWSAQFGRVPDIAELETKTTSTAMKSADYRASRAWVAFLLNESPQSRNVIANYLVAIQDGPPPGHFSRWLDQQMPDSRTRYLKYYGG